MGETTPFARPWRLALASAALALGLIAGCNGDSSDTVTVPATLEQNSGASNVTLNVFPSDEYLMGGVLQGFTAQQRANTSFVNQLDFSGETGYSTVTTIRIPFSPGPSVFQPSQGVAQIQPGASQIDVNSAPGNVRMYDVTGSTATEVTLAEFAVTPNNALTFRSLVPLTAGRTYGVVVLSGRLRTVSGGAVFASNAYAAIQQSGEASTDAGFAKVAAADPDIETRFNTISYFQFTTHDDTVKLTLLRQFVNGQIATRVMVAPGVIADVPIALVNAPNLGIFQTGATVLADQSGTPQTVAQFFAGAGAAGLPTTGIDRIAGGVIGTPNFISMLTLDATALATPGGSTLFTNGTIIGDNPDRTVPFDGTTNRVLLNVTAPLHTLSYVAFFPTIVRTNPTVPVPVVVGLHGLGRSKSDLGAIASAITARQMVLVAIDFYQHGDRQMAGPAINVPEGNFSTKPDASLAVLGIAFPDPFVNGFFLARSRDKSLQGFADLLSLIRLLAAANGSQSVNIDFNGDSNQDRYSDVRLVGQSLGGVGGTMISTVSPTVRRSFLSVPGGGIPAIVRESIEISPQNNFALDAAGTAPLFGLSAGRTDIPQYSVSAEREVNDIVSDTIIGPIDPLAYAPFLLNDGVSGGVRNPPLRVLVHYALNDRVVPNNANARLARAINVGAPSPTDFPHFVSGRNPQGQAFLFDMGIPTRNVDVDGFTRSGVSQYRGGHGFLFDFPSNAAATLSAQGEGATFLLGAPPFGP